MLGKYRNKPMPNTRRLLIISQDELELKAQALAGKIISYYFKDLTSCGISDVNADLYAIIMNQFTPAEPRLDNSKRNYKRRRTWDW